MSVDDHLYSPVVPGTILSNPLIQSDIRIPDIWLSIINGIRSIPGLEVSTIAGGALRDLDLGRQIKDVDIFVPYKEDMEKTYQSAFQHIVPDAYVEKVEHDLQCQTHSRLTVGISVPAHYIFYQHGWKFEITTKYEPFAYENIIDSFDLGICMIALDRHNGIHRAREYKHDVAANKITIVRQTGGNERHHATRLHNKYKGWTILG